jgi:hypothetical protein
MERKCVKYGSKDHWVPECPLSLYIESVGMLGKKVTVADIFHDPDYDYNLNELDDDDGYNSSDYRFIRGGTP